MRTQFTQDYLDKVYTLVEGGMSFEEVLEEFNKKTREFNERPPDSCKIKRLRILGSSDSIRYAYAIEKMKRDAYKRTPRYYIVGATWERTLEKKYGAVDKLPEFLENGYWCMGWDDGDIPYFTERRASIQIGDYLAVKRLNGSGIILIRAIGKVTGKMNNIVMVDWLYQPSNLVVNMRGCMGTIHGPFDLKEGDDPKTTSWNQWLMSIFTLR